MFSRIKKEQQQLQENKTINGKDVLITNVGLDKNSVSSKLIENFSFFSYMKTF